MYEVGTFYHNEINTNMAVFPLSVRAEKDVHLLICDSGRLPTPYTNLCYWIIIGGWENTKSVIRKCPKGVPLVEELPPQQSECWTERDKYYVRYIIYVASIINSLVV